MPKIQLLDFSGGINNSRQPHLLKSNEAVDLEDAGINSGSLVPNKGKAEVSQPVLPFLTNQNGDRSIVRVDDDYYWSENSTGTLNSTLGFFGITPPTELFSLIPGPVGDVLQGEYQYIIRFTSNNREQFSTAALPGAEDNGIKTISAVSIPTVVGNFPAFSTNNPLGFTDSFGRHIGYALGARVSFNSKDWQSRFNILSAVELTSSQSPGGSLNLWADISAATSDDLTVTGLEFITVLGFPAPTESQVDGIDIFRTLANGSVFYLVDTIGLNESSYKDHTTDAQLALREQLILSNAYPPIYEGEIRVGGKYLIEVDGYYWLAVDNKAYQSTIDINTWNPLHRIDFDSEITAFARFGAALMVFVGNGNPYLITGNFTNSTVSKIQIPTTQGCPNYKTIAYAGNAPVWQSNDGICIATKQPTGQDPQITVITDDRYNFTGLGDWAVSYKDCYYLFFNTVATVASVELKTCTVSGTLRTSGATETDIVNGGKTIILTLTNATWLSQTPAALATAFQPLLTGNQDGNSVGWDDVKVADLLAENTVVRTSSNVMTITLGASVTYNIAAIEQINLGNLDSTVLSTDDIISPDYKVFLITI